MKRKRYIKLLMAAGICDRNEAVQEAAYVQENEKSYSKAFDSLNYWYEMIARINMECDCLHINIGDHELFSSNYLGKRFLMRPMWTRKRMVCNDGDFC